MFTNCKKILCNKINVRHIGHEDLNWIELAQNGVQWQALVKIVMNICVT